ncbi:ATP-binding protein [Streptosporangium soli]|nr:ATP-binding protein [Streptosporangium sp. KLBMP 9127]
MNAVSHLTDRQLSRWCDLPQSPTASSIARRWVSALLASWELRLSADNEATIAELTSELVTNAVQHAAPAEHGGSGIRINVRAGSAVVWLAVCDPDPTLPRPRTPDFFSESGRGLFLVDAQADNWGAVPHADGKYVWFSLACLGDGEALFARSAGSTSPATNTKENLPCPPSSFPTTFTVPGRTA